MTTSPTASGAMPARATAARMAVAPSSGALTYHLLAVVDLRYALRIGIEAEHGKAGAREAD